MPTYSFRHPDTGEVFEKYLTYKEYNETKIDGDSYYQDEDGVMCKRALDVDTVSTSNQSPEGWPRTSYAAAVPVWKAKEMTEAARAAGVPTEHDKMGKPILTDPTHNKKYMEFRGLTDFDGGFNSPDCRGSQSEYKDKIKGGH